MNHYRRNFCVRTIVCSCLLFLPGCSFSAAIESDAARVAIATACALATSIVMVLAFKPGPDGDLIVAAPATVAIILGCIFAPYIIIFVLCALACVLLGAVAAILFHAATDSCKKPTAAQQQPDKPKSFFREIATPPPTLAGEPAHQMHSEGRSVSTPTVGFHPQERRKGPVCFLTGMQRLECTCDECAPKKVNGVKQ